MKREIASLEALWLEKCCQLDLISAAYGQSVFSEPPFRRTFTEDDMTVALDASVRIEEIDKEIFRLLDIQSYYTFAVPTTQWLLAPVGGPRSKKSTLPILINHVNPTFTEAVSKV